MKAFALCAMFLLIAVSSMASSQISNVKIVRIQTYKDYAAVRYEPARSNGENCSSAKYRENVFIVKYTDSSHADNMHATALSALHTGTTIGLGLDGCNGWGGGVPKAYRIDIFAAQ